MCVCESGLQDINKTSCVPVPGTVQIWSLNSPDPDKYTSGKLLSHARVFLDVLPPKMKDKFIKIYAFLNKVFTHFQFQSAFLFGSYN